MHEYSLIQSLVTRVESEARARRASSVHRVVVALGELSGVDPELFAIAYDTFRAGTLCEGAPLEVRRVEARWSCPGCGRAIHRGQVLACDVCRVPARLAPGGDEIVLETIEMEVP